MRDFQHTVILLHGYNVGQYHIPVDTDKKFETLKQQCCSRCDVRSLFGTMNTTMKDSIQNNRSELIGILEPRILGLLPFIQLHGFLTKLDRKLIDSEKHDSDKLTKLLEFAEISGSVFNGIIAFLKTLNLDATDIVENLERSVRLPRTGESLPTGPSSPRNPSQNLPLTGETPPSISRTSTVEAAAAPVMLDEAFAYFYDLVSCPFPKNRNPADCKQFLRHKYGDPGINAEFVVPASASWDESEAVYQLFQDHSDNFTARKSRRGTVVFITCDADFLSRISNINHFVILLHGNNVKEDFLRLSYHHRNFYELLSEVPHVNSKEGVAYGVNLHAGMEEDKKQGAEAETTSNPTKSKVVYVGSLSAEVTQRELNNIGTTKLAELGWNGAFLKKDPKFGSFYAFFNFNSPDGAAKGKLKLTQLKKEEMSRPFRKVFTEFSEIYFEGDYFLRTENYRDFVMRMNSARQSTQQGGSLPTGTTSPQNPPFTGETPGSFSRTSTLGAATLRSPVVNGLKPAFAYFYDLATCPFPDNRDPIDCVQFLRRSYGDPGSDAEFVVLTGASWDEYQAVYQRFKTYSDSCTARKGSGTVVLITCEGGVLSQISRINHTVILLHGYNVNPDFLRLPSIHENFYELLLANVQDVDAEVPETNHTERAVYVGSLRAGLMEKDLFPIRNTTLCRDGLNGAYLKRDEKFGFTFAFFDFSCPQGATQGKRNLIQLKRGDLQLLSPTVFTRSSKIAFKPLIP